MTASGQPARFCASCGRAASADAGFCAGCGRPLPRSAAPAPAPEPAPEPEQEIYSFRPLVLQGFGELFLAIVTVGIAALVYWLMRLKIRYRITNQRIEVRTGLLSVTRRSTELFRVEDFEVQEPFFLRLRGSGHLLVRSMDAGEPVEILRGIPQVHEVFDTVRRLALEQRHRYGVRLVEGL